jgi:hypothetical protein
MATHSSPHARMLDVSFETTDDEVEEYFAR